MSAGGLAAPRAGAVWIPVIGLEVHCQLKCATKLFCGCESRFGAPPNSLVCPACTGQPGALPVLNAEAVDLALRVALALGCEVAPRSRFERKSYFYPDLPKGYQISQYAEPLCTGGAVGLAGGKRVRLERIHLEEDAGKLLHDRADATRIDLNRAGAPLIEAVTRPDLAGAEEAVECLEALKEILQYVGASDCDMEKGSLRCDVNVSVHRQGEPWGPRVELKNLNSFKNIAAALRHEIARQAEARESGDPARAPVQETRLYDPGRGETRPMRGKEEAHDYRYLPDPDLPPLEVPAATLERARATLPELPAARRARYVSSLLLSEYDARALTASRGVADFFEAVARLSGEPKEAANWILNDVLGALADPAAPARSVDELAFKPYDLSELIGLVRDGRLSKTSARTVFKALFTSPRSPRELMKDLGLEQVSDEASLERWCREALAGAEKTVSDVRAGELKALGPLVGGVLKASGGKANPQVVRQILLRLIGGAP